jgi:circadian clock protein KaiC
MGDETPRLIATGVPGFDELLGGGLPDSKTVMITGEPGTGKTVLCSQIAFGFAARGGRALM